MPDQIVIKALLLIAVAVIGLVVLWPGQGTRRVALRRLALLLLTALAALAVIFPDSLSAVAKLLGVGRGTDLMLYVLIVAFLGYVIASRRHRSKVDAQVTELARAQAISTAARPGSRKQ